MAPEDITDGGRGPLTLNQVDPDKWILGHPAGNYVPWSGPKNPIGPVNGYPETGKDAWRRANDDAIVAATAKYNSENGFSPSDALYIAPQLMKSWMMHESGGDRHAFGTDPFQVNVTADWVGRKKEIAGLAKGQAMTPEVSAEAALRWLRYKGIVHNSDGSIGRYKSRRDAFMNYNGNDRLQNGVPHKMRYADSVLNRARDSYGDWWDK
jgi:hypothetical protein